jgi:hypothetical protein
LKGFLFCFFSPQNNDLFWIQPHVMFIDHLLGAWSCTRRQTHCRLETCLNSRAHNGTLVATWGQEPCPELWAQCFHWEGGRQTVCPGMKAIFCCCVKRIQVLSTWPIWLVFSLLSGAPKGIPTILNSLFLN